MLSLRAERLKKDRPMGLGPRHAEGETAQPRIRWLRGSAAFLSVSLCLRVLVNMLGILHVTSSCCSDSCFRLVPPLTRAISAAAARTRGSAVRSRNSGHHTFVVH